MEDAEGGQIEEIPLTGFTWGPKVINFTINCFLLLRLPFNSCTVYFRLVIEKEELR